MDSNPTALEMINRLIGMGLITPISEYQNLMMPTLYRSVPSIASSGTGHISFEEGHNDAKLYGANEANSQDAGGATGC
jgi:hypothetical protein